MRLRAQKVVALAAEIVWAMRFTEDTPEALQTMWADIRAIATQAIKDMGESEERGESEQPG